MTRRVAVAWLALVAAACTPSPGGPASTSQVSETSAAETTVEPRSQTTTTTVVPSTGTSQAPPPDATTTVAPAPPVSNLPDGLDLYVDPDSRAARWVSQNIADPRAAAIGAQIASIPTARWITAGTPADLEVGVGNYVEAAVSAGAVPQIVVYLLPDRDCGGASAGGAIDFESYAARIDAIASALGDELVIVLLEPDSLALWDCLDESGRVRRSEALASAVDTLTTANASARVYLDAGHSAWHPADVMAGRLRGAGLESASGFMTNVSNYRTTTDEVAYGDEIRRLVGRSFAQVIDTSRNGAGPSGDDWCDPSGRLLGDRPMLNPDAEGVDAFLWVKPPGEADGCAAAAGAFDPDLAVALIGD